MSPAAQAVTHLLAVGTVAGQLVVLAGVVALLAPRSAFGSATVALLGRFALPVGFAVALAGTVGSLYYSEGLGFAPCVLCWVQRIFLYPQVVLLGMALLRRDRGVAPYGVALSSLGLAVAVYNHYLQLGGAPLVPCSTTGVSCSLRYIWEFGYITMPLMSATAFALVIVLLLAVRRGTHLTAAGPGP